MTVAVILLGRGIGRALRSFVGGGTPARTSSQLIAGIREMPPHLARRESGPAAPTARHSPAGGRPRLACKFRRVGPGSEASGRFAHMVELRAHIAPSKLGAATPTRISLALAWPQDQLLEPSEGYECGRFGLRGRLRGPSGSRSVVAAVVGIERQLARPNTSFPRKPFRGLMLVGFTSRRIVLGSRRCIFDACKHPNKSQPQVRLPPHEVKRARLPAMISRGLFVP
jgi:hypothetical protein